MSSNMKRMTFVITPEIEALLDEAKKELFYGCSRSEMVRELLLAGTEKMLVQKETANSQTA